MVGSLNISDSSVEVWRGSDAYWDSIFKSGCSPKKIKISPIEKWKKNARVTFNLPAAEKTDSEEDCYEEPESPQRQSPLKPSRRVNVLPEEKNEKYGQPAQWLK